VILIVFGSANLLYAGSLFRTSRAILKS